MIPAIAPRQDLPCAICGTLGDPDTHHVVHRSMGGADGPTLSLCRRCHDNAHPEKQGSGWTLSLSDDVLYVLDGDTILVERPLTFPEGWDEGLFIAQLSQAPRQLQDLSAGFRFLSDEGIRAAAEALGELVQVGWVLRARLFRTALLRTPYGGKADKLREIARLFGLERSQAYKEARAIELAEKYEVVHDMDKLTPDAILLAETSGDPEAAMTLLLDRRVANPAYSMSQFKEELKRDNLDSLNPTPAWCVCPTCGRRHVEAET